ncbi:MAG TPA: hypothetical protein DIW64_01395 [Cellvibrio sp.]|nr:hypothetical protein [Cellvibrio sp.]
MENYHWILLSAFIGAASALFAAYWRTRYTIKSQDLSKRIEELCDSITKLEDLSCTYWSDSEERKIPSTHYILGVKTKIGLIISYMDDEYKKFHKDDISILLADFFDACTGGKFEDGNNTNEPERQRKILISGEKLKIELMKFRNKLY